MTSTVLCFTTHRHADNALSSNLDSDHLCNGHTIQLFRASHTIQARATHRQIFRKNCNVFLCGNLCKRCRVGMAFDSGSLCTAPKRLCGGKLVRVVHNRVPRGVSGCNKVANLHQSPGCHLPGYHKAVSRFRNSFRTAFVARDDPYKHRHHRSAKNKCHQPAGPVVKRDDGHSPQDDRGNERRQDAIGTSRFPFDLDHFHLAPPLRIDAAQLGQSATALPFHIATCSVSARHTLHRGTGFFIGCFSPIRRGEDPRRVGARANQRDPPLPFFVTGRVSQAGLHSCVTVNSRQGESGGSCEDSNGEGKCRGVNLISLTTGPPPPPPPPREWHPKQQLRAGEE